VIITAVERQRRRRRVNVFVDGIFVLALSPDLATERGVRAGRAVTEIELAELAEAEARRGAKEAALRLVSYRPRSERELRERLDRKGFPRPAVEETLRRLRELGLLDDAAFARFWAETRQAARPRSRRLLVGELRQRGVAAEVAEEAVADVSDEAAAYEAASGRMRKISGLEYQPFREKLGRFLTGRGFPYDVSRRVIQRCWEELGGERAAESDFSR